MALREATVATHELPLDERKAFAKDMQELAGQVAQTEDRFAKQSAPRFWWSRNRYDRWRNECLEIRKVFAQTTRKLECLVESRRARLDMVAAVFVGVREVYDALRPYMKLDVYLQELQLLECEHDAVGREMHGSDLTLWDSIDRIESLEKAASRLAREADNITVLMKQPDVDFGFTVNRAKLIRQDLMLVLAMVDQLDESAHGFMPRLRFDGGKTPEELRRQLKVYDDIRERIEAHLNRATFIRNATKRLPTATFRL